MAAYFDYEKKIPHVNNDDIYVKNGSIKDDKLVLEYSIADVDPLSISLSSVDKMTYIDNAEFIDNKLILKYNRLSIANLSIDLSALDKHVASTMMSDDKSVLSLCFNDGTAISVDTTKYTENFFISSWSVNGKNLILKYNTLTLDPLVIDLERIATKILDLKTIGNTLSVVDAFGQGISVDLEKFSYNDFINGGELDALNQLILKYSTDKASGKAKDFSIDLARLAQNYYIEKANLCNETLKLDYNAQDRSSLSVDMAPINNYIKDATIIDKTLVLSYNSDRFAALSVNVADFIKDYYIKDVKLDNDNKLHFIHNNDLIHIDPIDLTRFDTYINSITLQNDHILKFDYSTTAAESKAINLTRYANALCAMHLHPNDGIHPNGNYLMLEFENGLTNNVSLDKFDKYISSYEIDSNNLSLLYNSNKGCIVLNKAQISKAITNAYIEDNIFYFNYSDGTNPLTVDLTDNLTHIVAGEVIDNTLKLSYSNSTDPLLIDMSTLNTYVNNVSLDNSANLKLSYNANKQPINVSLTALNTKIIETTRSDNIITLKFANGESFNLDLSYFNKYLKSAQLNKELKKIDFSYNDNSNAFSLNLNDTCYELTAGSISDKNNIILLFSNGKQDIEIDTSNFKAADTFIATADLRTDDVLVLDYNTATPAALEVDLHKFARNDYINAGHVAYNKTTPYLILDYNNQDGFSTKLTSLSVELPRGGGSSENYYIENGRFDINDKKLVLEYNTRLLLDLKINYNILSGMYFKASDERSILSIAQAIEQIVEAFGGNR